MNLIRDPWIPALRSDGTRALFSLHDLFAQADTLRDLAVKPHERVALMRLLICITHGALEGPDDEGAWQTCLPQIQPRVGKYLDAQQPAFELFGPGPRFLQVPNLSAVDESRDGNAATKLDLTLATGNNSTLFDTRAGERREMSPARSALNLLTFQCFAPGGRIGVAKWDGADTAGKGSSTHAPCTPSSMAHTLVLGKTLLETVHHNLLSRKIVHDVFGANGWGKPVWEHPVAGASDDLAVRNATTTFLGRLVPLSRAIRLEDDGYTIVLGNGLTYPIFPAFREATATIIKRKDELALLPTSTSKSLWRQLAAITVTRRVGADVQCGPLALRYDSGSPETSLWVGSLVTDKAKIEDVVESTFALPAGMFTDFGRAAYEKGVGYAETWEGALMQAVKIYASTLKVVAPPYDRARREFWTHLEQQLGALFELARHPDLIAELPRSPWGAAAYDAAVSSFRQVCPPQSPRQVQAHALGRAKLFVPPGNTLPTPKPNE